MKIALAYSSKLGLYNEYARRYPKKTGEAPEAPAADCFAEGDTPETIEAVCAALRSCGHEVFPLEADIELAGVLLKIKPDMVFNIAEGLFGDSRESYVPMICEKLSLPYTGSGPLTAGICLHKGRCKEILTANRIANPPFLLFTDKDDIEFPNFRFPGIVKPVAEGSSKGIFDKSVADNAETAKKLIKESLKKYNQSVILEEFLPGAEYTAAGIGNINDLEILPLVGLDFTQLPNNAHKIYSYEAKWVWDTPKSPLRIFQCPAETGETLKEKIKQLIYKTFRALELRDWCRIDIRLDSRSEPNIIEVNPIPGILPNPEDNSCFPKAARAAGYSYAQIFEKVIESAKNRYTKGR